MAKAHITINSKRYIILDIETPLINPHSIYIFGSEVKEVKEFDDTCLYCKGPNAFEQYTVLDELWPYEPKAGCLHLKCLEIIIGRKITVADLSDASWNDMLRHVLDDRSRDHQS